MNAPASRLYQLLYDAIANRRPVTCVYQGLSRECCPHILGTTADEQRVLMFQYAGDSLSGLPPGGEWRCMAVAKLTWLVVKTGPWHTAPARSEIQSCIELVAIEAAENGQAGHRPA
jgi:hypothetical protein